MELLQSSDEETVLKGAREESHIVQWDKQRGETKFLIKALPASG